MKINPINLIIQKNFGQIKTPVNLKQPKNLTTVSFDKNSCEKVFQPNTPEELSEIDKLSWQAARTHHILMARNFETYAPIINKVMN